MNVPHRIIFIENPQASDGAVSIAEQLGLGYDLVAPARRRSSSGGGEVIELSNSRAARRRSGGHNPRAQQVLTKWEVTGRVRIGHTISYDDDSAPIIVREADDVHPVAGGVGYVEGRCTAYIARPVIARGEAETLLILEHQPGCPVMAGLLREAGAVQ